MVRGRAAVPYSRSHMCVSSVHLRHRFATFRFLYTTCVHFPVTVYPNLGPRVGEGPGLGGRASLMSYGKVSITTKVDVHLFFSADMKEQLTLTYLLVPCDLNS